jgi:hypothetical protein
MDKPAIFAERVEQHPQLPPGGEERVAGYGIMGLPFRSEHVLGLRRWTASSMGEAFTSIWHRDPSGRWTFYESVPSEIGCTRYFGAEVERVRVGPIELAWEASHCLRIRTRNDGQIDWTVEIGSTPTTRAMSLIGSTLPRCAWRSRPILATMEWVAGWALAAGKINLRGTTSNGQHFEANPQRIWYVTKSRALIDGQDVGPIGPLSEQTRIADFYIPQRGIFAMGRVFVTP